jgi:hypothetical protein
MAEDDPAGPAAHRPYRLDILPDSQAERFAAHQPGRAEPRQQGQDGDEKRKRRPELRRQIDEEIDDGYGEDDIHQPHQDHVGQTAEEAGDDPVEHADRGRGGRHREAHLQRAPAARHEPAEDVVAQVVGA